MLSLPLFVICLGPVCVPIWGILPLLAYCFNYVKNWCTKAGKKAEQEKKPIEANTTEEDQEQQEEETKEQSSLRKRNTNNTKKSVVQVTNVEIWENAQKDNVPVLIKFTATWCRPCQTIAPLYKNLASTSEHIHFLELDVDNKDVAGIKKQANVGPIPDVQLWQGNKKIDGHIGANKNKLNALVEKAKSL